MNKTVSKPSMMKVNSIDDVASGSTCLHCGLKYKPDHTCDKSEANKKLEKSLPQERWAFHNTCGKVMMLQVKDGIALIESDIGRYAVPLCDLQFGNLSKVLDEIEKLDLSQDEAEKLINILRIHCKDFSIPEHPTLTPGCRIEVQLGNVCKKATVKSKVGHGYIVEIDDGTTVTVYAKHIVRIV